MQPMRRLQWQCEEMVVVVDVGMLKHLSAEDYVILAVTTSFLLFLLININFFEK